MNIGSVSSFLGAGATTRQSPFKQIKQDFQKLQQALKSGDLQGAKDAYAQLQKDLPSKDSSSSPTSSNQPKSDLDAIGAALQSGDLSGAQKAFATFQQDLQSLRGAHSQHHHHHDSDGDSDDNNTTSSGAVITNNSFTAQA